jgi:Transposase DDE domain
VLELYRGRWQVELAFKRLKSILATGHLKKTDPLGAKAWLQGKLLAAVIIETLINLGERFSPWGYPLPECASALSVARDRADEIPA